MPHSALSRAAATLVTAGGARRRDARRTDRPGRRRRRPHGPATRLRARPSQRPEPAPRRRSPARAATPPWRCATCGCSATTCPRPTARRTPSSPAARVKPHDDGGRQHPDPLRPRRDGRPSPPPTCSTPRSACRQAYSARRLPHSRCPTARSAATRSTDIYVDTLQQGLYGYCTTDQQHADRSRPVRRVGLLRGRQRLRRLPDQHADGEPPGDRGARVLPRHPVRLRLRRRRLGHGGDRGLGRGRGLRRRQRQRPVPRRQPDHRPQARRSTSSAALFHYGVWIFFRYLTEKFPERDRRHARRSSCEVLEGGRQLQGRQEGQVLHPGDGRGAEGQALQDLPVDKAFALFSDANRRAPQVYDEGAANNYPVAKLNGKKALNKGQAKRFKATLDHLIGATYRYTPKGNAKKLQGLDLRRPEGRRAPARSSRPTWPTARSRRSTSRSTARARARSPGSFKKSKVDGRRGDAGQRQRPLRQVLQEEHAVLVLGQADGPERADLGRRQGGLTKR